MKEGKEEVRVVKIGGNVINDPAALQHFLNDFASLPGKKVLVHGGGKRATEIGKKLGIVSRYQEGRRITDRATIELVTMVYGGLINKNMVAQLQALDCNAIGLTGADANCIPAVKRPVKAIDYGFAGDVKAGLKIPVLKLFLENKLIPVFAPLTHDGKGQLLNTNADTIASILATALAEDYHVRLMYCFEKKGVLRDINDENSVVPLINKEIYQKMLDQKALADGILPKLHNAFDAIDRGVASVLIGHANDLVKNTGDQVSGTLIK